MRRRPCGHPEVTVEDSESSGIAGGGGRRERKKVEVRDRIRAAALSLFRERGYEATTVEEIAERADVAKGTFFNYFPRKDSLLVALGEEMMEQLQDELGPQAEWTGSAQEQVLRFFLALGSFVERDPEVSKVMMIENLRTFWLRQEKDPVEVAFEAISRKVLRDAMERGELPREMDVEVAAKLLEAAYITTMVDWLKGGTLADRYRAELTKKITIVFRGLQFPESGTEGREGR
jgi:TetR/AcrR family transcriptional regulator, cholesterol catabolism regulator